ncbi:MAG: NAD(P)H-dependent oxidoreductase subunit E, partial [Burkholderiales bacterium]|nr:NAD(P)H-dependent oxidoreductase subunit E [Burkholderiales bacterium]
MDASLNAELSALLDAHRDRPGALLPVLHAVQDALGHIPSAAVPIIARALNLSRAEVHGVIGFYRH